MPAQVLTPASGPSHVRRLSNHVATKEDMAQGPVVVMPPKKLVAASESHENNDKNCPSDFGGKYHIHI